MTRADQLLNAARSMLSPGMGCAVTMVGEGQLLHAEEACIRRAVPQRRAEFASGRLALRRAIADAGYELPPDIPIVTRADRRPDLPGRLSVSLSHAGGFCIAIATQLPRVGLGIDIEPLDAQRPDQMAASIRPYRFRTGAGDPLAAFSAKEALFKRQYPQTGRMLDFGDIALIMGADTFSACVAGYGFMRGTWARIAGFYLTVSAGPTRQSNFED